MRTILAILLALPVFAGDNLLTNGDLAEWKDGAPAGWEVMKGAGSDFGELSVLEKGGDGGMRLAGGKATGQWRVVKQQVKTDKERRYVLRFESRARGLALEPGQFDNANVQVFVNFQRMPRVTGSGTTFHPLDWEPEYDWTPTEILLEPKLSLVVVSFFLSKTGSLEIRNVALAEASAGDSADLLVSQVGRTYSYFDAKKLDWGDIASRHREALRKAADPAAFADEACAMLAELKDIHVTVSVAHGPALPTFSRSWERNFSFDAIVPDLEDAVQFRKSGCIGKTSEGFVYLALLDLTFDDGVLESVVAEILKRADAPGFILDLRANSGGDEKKAQAIAGLFADKERVYALSRVRNGPGPRHFGPPRERLLRPRDGTPITKPVIVLTGPGCISSGEGFVKMMKALPHVTLVGGTTAGASANPVRVELPNGVTVHVSSWVDLLPDGTATEGKGIAPDVAVEFGTKGDAPFEKAVQLLKEKAKK